MILQAEGYEQDKNGDVTFPEKEYGVAIDTTKVSFVRIISFRFKDQLKRYCSVVFDSGEFIVVSEDFFNAYIVKE